MRPFLAFALLLTTLIACNSSDSGPDVSSVKIDLVLERFDEDFFALDTNNLAGGLETLKNKYPDFYPVFMQRILGVKGDTTDELTHRVTREFLHGYGPIQDTIGPIFKTASLKADLEKAFRHLKFYFPDYKIGKAYTFLGPFDAPGAALVEGGISIGIQQYAGKNFSLYQSPLGLQMFPLYISRRFEPQYISTNCIKLALDEMYPDSLAGRPLIEQIVEQGKKWYLLDKVLPYVSDSIKTGYTNKQLDWCRENEGNIWAFILESQGMNSIDPVTIQTFIGEGPFTHGMPESSPGNIGQWVGWQIVKKWMTKNSTTSLDALMKKDARKLLEESGYKPK